MRHDIAPGSVFPDYELPDHTGTPRKLSELHGDDSLILTLARGHYCPKDLAGLPIVSSDDFWRSRGIGDHPHT